MNKKYLLPVLLGLFLLLEKANAREVITCSDCICTLDNGVLTLENSLISRSYSWNGGNLITRSITDKAGGKVWVALNKKPDLLLPGESENARDAIFSPRVADESATTPEHLEATITYALGSLEIKRVFRIYPGSPAIACDLYFRGNSDHTWVQPDVNLADMVNIEKLSAANAGTKAPVIEALEFPGRHWQLNAVEFFDITDRFNTLVRSVRALSYRPNLYRGNLLFALDRGSDHGLFFLKEAPTSGVQLAYPGGDFMAEYGSFRVVGAGVNPSDLKPDEWTRGYGFVTGVFSGGESNGQIALRVYQKNLRILKPDRDEMVLMNTWGDRSQDKRVNERFSIAELEAGARLGITHFQLDDGWQTGRSANSAFKGGTLDAIWENPRYWEPHPERFPNGLGPVVRRGKELGIEVCLWFNPSRDDSNALWEKDADALVELFRKYGIRTFKIDGVMLPDKTAEENFRKFLDKVRFQTRDEAVFNLDVTAGRRGGYHYFNEYGNLFLENRYTDWTNYYPYTTLRNLWMLSAYVPAEKLQIEFLNKWRNAGNYKDDPFGPAHYTFDYLFAITLVAQPLAWFEGTGLPAEAFEAVSPVIKRYREIQHDLHKGMIFPIGDEPTGRNWTGFQSVKEGKGYLMIFREANPETECRMKTWLKPGTRIRCNSLLGNGKSFKATTANDGSVNFRLKDINSFALYEYQIIQ